MKRRLGDDCCVCIVLDLVVNENRWGYEFFVCGIDEEDDLRFWVCRFEDDVGGVDMEEMVFADLKMVVVYISRF